ncbi:MAG: hypothetical protein R3F48_07765 [Candidatus Zixiibacteriota bacterium]
MEIIIAIIAIIGIWVIAKHWMRISSNEKRINNEMQQLGLSMEELAGLDREEAEAKIARAQQKYRESLLAKGIDIYNFMPVIGQDIAWIDIVRHVFRILEFDRGGTVVGPNNEVKAESMLLPYGYLIAESPILNQPVKIPICHAFDFLQAAMVFDSPEIIAEIGTQYELLVTYAPKKAYSDGRGKGQWHVMHYVITPHGTLDRYYDYEYDQHMKYPKPEKLFGQFIYEGETSIEFNNAPDL